MVTSHSFLFGDLVERAKAIASLDPHDRRAVYDSGAIYNRFPLSYPDSLRHGYKCLAAEHEQKQWFYRAIQCWVKALVIAAANYDNRDCAAITEQVARLSMYIHDTKTAINYLTGGIRLAEEAGDEELRQRLTERLRFISR